MLPFLESHQRPQSGHSRETSYAQQYSYSLTTIGTERDNNCLWGERLASLVRFLLQAAAKDRGNQATTQQGVCGTPQDTPEWSANNLFDPYDTQMHSVDPSALLMQCLIPRSYIASPFVR